MKKMRKKYLWISALILSIFAFAIIGIQGNVQASDAYTWNAGDNVTATLSGNVLTFSGTGPMKNYSFSTIPEWVAYCGTGKNITVKINEGITTIASYAFYQCAGLTSISIPTSVTSISDSAFCECAGLKNITIPAGVTNIGSFTFQSCTGLTSITIPWGITKIENGAFMGCTGLTSITIPTSVTCIGRYAFCFCDGMTSITIPSGVTSIEDCAFLECIGLQSITIPASVADIKEYAFAYCDNLKSISVEASNKYYCTVNNILYSKDMKVLIQCPPKLTEKVIEIPPNVTSIGLAAFSRGSDFTNITIPSSVTSIGEYAFSGCSGLTNIIFPSGITCIDNGMFIGCSGLTNFIIPTSVTSIKSNAFNRCTGLTSITIPTSVTSIESNAFVECKMLASITIPSSVTSIGDYAFCNCINLTGTFTISSNVKSIGTGIILDTNFDKVINNSSVSMALNALTSTLKDIYWVDGNNIKISTIKNGTAYRRVVNKGTPCSITATVSKTSTYVGDSITISAIGAGGAGSYTYKFLVYNKDTKTWAALQNFSSSSSFTWIAGSVGNREFYVDVKDADGAVVRSTAMNVTTTKPVTAALSITANASTKANNVGGKVTFTAAGAGGSGTYTYKYLVYNKDTGTWALLQNFSNNACFTWTAGSVGNREFYVDVKDSTGKVVRSAVMNVATTTANSGALAITAKASASSVTVGTKVTFSATGTGGSGSYTYKILVYNKTTNTWAKLQDFSSNSSFVWTAGSVGNREFYVDVMDSTGKVVRSTVMSVVTK